MFQQPHLPGHAAAVSSQASAGPHHPVAGNDQADGVVAHGAAYGLGRHLFFPRLSCHLPGDGPIGHGLSIRDGQHDPSHLLPENTAGQFKGRGEAGILPLEIQFQPAAGLLENGQVRISPGSGQFLFP